VSEVLTNGSQKILKVLAQGPCTPKQLRERTGLSERTISHHLRILQQQDPPVISKRWMLEDARQAVYSIIKS